MTEKIDAFKEGILKDKELGEEGWLKQFETPAKKNPIYTKLFNEGLYRDVAGALGAVQNIVWAAAFPNLISRQIIKVLPTKNALERFPKEYIPIAFDTNEAPALKTGRRAEFQDVVVGNEIKCAQSWTESYIEDAAWDVLSWQIEGNGRAIARKELKKVIHLYSTNDSTGIPSADLAGGAEITIASANAITWDTELLALINVVEKEDFVPSVVALKPAQFNSLRNMQQFTSSLYWPGPAKTGGNMPPIGAKEMRSAYYSTLLGVTFVTSTEVTKPLAIDIDAAAALLVRRDITSKPYAVPEDNAFGVYTSERIGMGVLRTKAVARGSQ